MRASPGWSQSCTRPPASRPSTSSSRSFNEAFILWDVISDSQDLSRTIATSLSHLAVHNPIPKWHGLISGVAFPYSPPEIDRGPVYEFHLNHLLVPDSPTALFRTEFEEV